MLKCSLGVHKDIQFIPNTHEKKQELALVTSEQGRHRENLGVCESTSVVNFQPWVPVKDLSQKNKRKPPR